MKITKAFEILPADVNNPKAVEIADSCRDILAKIELETILDIIDNEDFWVWCKCFNCKSDGTSHAVNTTKSIEKLKTFLREELMSNE